MDDKNLNDEQYTKVFNIIKDEATPLNLPNTKKKKRMFSLVNTLAFAMIIFLTLSIIIGIIGLGFTYKVVQDSPKLKVSDFIGDESTKIYAADGELIQEIGIYLRENITYDEIPEGLIDAFLSVEDSRFFKHFGFDIPRFSKAIIENIRSRNFGQGGSTFTMQLVKNTYFQVDNGDTSTVAKKSIDRKLQEIFLAIELEKKLDKKKIIELYLNKLNFGGNIRGVEKAAQYYFGKKVSELNLSEQALLAGIINRPNSYNPYNYLDYATKRRNTVLNLMNYHGYITKTETELAKSIKIEDQLVGENYKYGNVKGNEYRSYLDAVINEAQSLTGKDPYITGMSIYTNMNKEVQKTIDSIQDGTSEIKWPDELMQVAMISINNNTGAIVGIGGGRNYDGARLLNRATSQFKQPGSAVKPFLSYALAFEHLGYSDQMILTDRPITYPNESRVIKNFDGNYRGDITIQQASAQSLNIPAILTLKDVVDEIGKKEVVKYLNSLGFTKVTDKNFHLSFAIGGTWFESTVLEMAGAHATMINGGIYNKPHTVSKVVLQDGDVIYPQDQNRKVISSGSAYLTSELMRYNVEGPYFNYMQILKRNYPVYAKTGTTDWGSDGIVYNIPKGAAKDKWMIASTSNYTNAVWVGYDKGIKDQNTYYSAYKSSLNIPGRINKMLLDADEKLSNELPKEIEKPNDVEEITYVRGTWPYAKYESWIDPSLQVTANVSKAGKKELVDIKSHVQGQEFNGISASILPDGSLSVSWSVGNGGCFGDTKDISLHDNYNDVPAYGACLFDYAWVLGSSGNYGAKVFVNDSYIADISSNNGYYVGWPGDMWGSVKVCGWYSNGETTSETKCAEAIYPQ